MNNNYNINNNKSFIFYVPLFFMYLMHTLFFVYSKTKIINLSQNLKIVNGHHYKKFYINNILSL